MLRKYVLEASLLKVLQAAVPIVTDAEMTAGGLHRFHAVIQVKKAGPHHDGLQRNAIMASFGALKDLDMVIVVDDDIDHPRSGRRGICARDAHGSVARPDHRARRARPRICPRRPDRGIHAKLGIDATVPFADKARFARCEFKPVEVDAAAMTTDAAAARKRLDL